MRIGLQTWGSEGDIRPFLALAKGLKDAGHSVSLAITSVDGKSYDTYAERYAIPLQHVAMPIIDDEAVLEEIGLAIVGERNPLKQAATIVEELFEPVVADMYNAARRLCTDNDLLIGHFIHYPLRIAAEITGTPHASVTLAHNAIPSILAPPTGLPNLGPTFNALCWKALRFFLNRFLLSYPNRLRAQHGLAPAQDLLNEVWISPLLNLIAVSPVFCETRQDWDDNNQVCGFLNLANDSGGFEWAPDLDDFLNTGTAPVYITFGSLAPRSAQERQALFGLFAEAAKLADCRIIIQVEAHELARLSSDERIYYTAPLPHQKIFPRCAAVVHHGGAGTTQSATSAGVPSIVVPHIEEQVFWGLELKRLGIAPKVLRRSALSAKSLARLITQVLNNDRMKETALKISNTMKQENGVKNAVHIIERLG